MPATSSGGYGSSQNIYAPSAQRGRPRANDTFTPDNDNNTGALSQSTTGIDLRGEVLHGDAMQGTDGAARDSLARDKDVYTQSRSRDQPQGGGGARGLGLEGDQSALENRAEAEQALGEQFQVGVADNVL